MIQLGTFYYNLYGFVGLSSRLEHAEPADPSQEPQLLASGLQL